MHSTTLTSHHQPMHQPSPAYVSICSHYRFKPNITVFPPKNRNMESGSIMIEWRNYVLDRYVTVYDAPVCVYLRTTQFELLQVARNIFFPGGFSQSHGSINDFRYWVMDHTLSPFWAYPLVGNNQRFYFFTSRANQPNNPSIAAELYGQEDHVWTGALIIQKA